MDQKPPTDVYLQGVAAMDGYQRRVQRKAEHVAWYEQAKEALAEVQNVTPLPPRGRRP
jgi:4'-phosphopantetheinyl transferase EntD